MLESLISQWQSLSLLSALLVGFVLQLLIYLALVAGSYVLFGGLRTVFSIGALSDSRPFKPNQLRHELSYSLSTCAVLGLYTVISLKISSTIWPTSWLVALLQVVVFYVLYDFYFYWWHRLLHTLFFSSIHGKHHRSIRVSPWSVHSLHPVEAAGSYWPVVLFAAICNPGVGVVFLVLFVLVFESVGGHSNYNPLRPSWLVHVFGFHQLHHEFGRSNFGFVGTHWDSVFGTSEPKHT
jgi:lathosterol oxidase